MANTKSDKRENGAGSISLRKDGRWQGSILIGRKMNGKLDRRFVYGKTEREVKRKLLELKRTAYAEIGLETSDMTVQEYMTRWLVDIKKNELKPASFARLSQVLHNQIFDTIGFISASALSPSDIQKLINDLRDGGKSFSSIKKVYLALNACYNMGVIRGDFHRNPCLGVRLPKIIEKDISDTVKFYQEDDVIKICQEATSKFQNGRNKYRLGWAIVLLLYTGMRIGELLALTWDDVTDTHININKNTVVVSNKIIDQSSTKTNSGIRKIPLSKKAKKAIDELREITGEYKYVMTTKNGGRIYPRNVDRTFRDICRVCNLPINGVHSLRHTFASMLFKNKCDVQVVSKLLGHSDPSITRRIYIHIIEEQKEDAIQNLDQYSF